jgi:hypothetical protein
MWCTPRSTPEAEQELAAALQIRSIPTIMAFREGVLVYSQPGAMPAPMLEELITKVKDLDMEEVRASIAAPGRRIRLTVNNQQEPSCVIPSNARAATRPPGPVAVSMWPR